ncbi:hypothetical protein [Actinomadura sp. HBU206391]|uniref:DUF7544 domain-containing protein n=1 Tax=Actinomadura sp. HBU206391 TaxID=2731692 RepID=UPI00164F8CBF|nr:hypothetical protein [Actinomadura sp. HBU206391]MBC6456777.1 hypothetical protein [Actinomadura sp. HBU206391]
MTDDPQPWTTPGSGLPSGPPAPPSPASAGRPSAARRALIDSSELLGGDIPLRPLGTSELLDGAITSIRRNARPVLAVSLAVACVIQVLVTIATYFFIGGDGGDELTPVPVMRTLGTQLTVGAVGLLLSALGVLVLAGLLGPVMGRTLFGMSTSLREAWSHTRPQLPRLLGVSLIIMAISLLAMTLPLVPFVLLAATDGPAVAGVLAGIVGFPAAIVATLWLYVLFVLAAPAVVMERRGVIDSMRRAHQLVQRKWWRTFGTLFVTALITVFMGFLALRVPFTVVQFAAFGTDPSGVALVLSLAVDTLGRIIAWTLMSPFDAGVIALFYIDQRMRREGLDLELQTRPSDEPPPEDFLELWRTSPLVPSPGRAGRSRPPAPPAAVPAHPAAAAPAHQVPSPGSGWNGS